MKNNTKIIGAVDRNIATIHQMRIESDEKRSPDQKIIDYIAHFAGRPLFLYLHAVSYGSWLISGKRLEIVGLAASLEAIFLSLFVLINQRRMDAIERKNSDLHLQMSLLAEHELTRIARVSDLIAKHLGVSTSTVQDFEAVKKDVLPNEVLNRISEHEEKSKTSSASDGTKK